MLVLALDWTTPSGANLSHNDALECAQVLSDLQLILLPAATLKPLLLLVVLCPTTPHAWVVHCKVAATQLEESMLGRQQM